MNYSLVRISLTAFFAFLLSFPSQAAALKSASITAIVNDVNVVNSGQGTRPAKLNETISGQSSVQTGLKSRTELLFSDNTMARLGANTMFSFTNGTRDIDLKQGTMLLQVPKGAGGAKITTAAVTAAITGTTIMIEHFPGGFSKVIVLEGTLRLFLNNRLGESILLEPGKMIILNPNATQLPEPVDVDIKRLVKTSKLIKAIDGTEMDLKIVQEEIDKQDKEKAKGDLIGTNLVITGSGTEVILASEDLLNTLENASFEQQNLFGENSSGGGGVGPTPPAPPGPTKFNPVTTITSPNPYVINSTTTIVTDPTITTNGVTDQGTLYNSTIQPGNTSAFLFGSTSVFDTASGFDSVFLGQDYSVFRFSQMQLAGSPTINTVGGPTKLFLVSEGNIESTSGSFPVDFSGLDFLGLATVNGYISLGSSITNFTGPTQLDLHARGIDSGSFEGYIFIDAPVTLGAGSSIGLYAESGIDLNSAITADTVNIRSFGSIYNTPLSEIIAKSITMNASQTITFEGGTIDTTNLTNLTVTGGEILFNGSMDFSGVAATFSAGTSGITGATGVSVLNFTSMNTTGDIDFSGTNTSNISASGIIAATGNINVNGTVSAGSIGAGNNITADILASATNINSTLGNITTQSGAMTATNNITAAGNISSAAAIIAGDLLQGSGISASADITAGSMEATGSGGIVSSGGGILSNAGKIKSAGNIEAQNGNISSANNIEALGNVIANGGIIAIGTISGVDILANGNGDITSGGNITATGDLGTLYANTATSSTGTITANRIVGGNDPGAASGSTTFTAGTIIANNVVIRNGDNPLSLDAAIVTINGQTTDISGSTFTSTVQNLTLNGANPVTLAISSALGSAGTPLNNLNTNANVTISGSNSIYATNGTIGGDITLGGANGNLFTNLMTVAGNLSVNQIKRTSFAGTQNISVSGTIEASGTYGLDFQGVSGANGGKLSLTGSSVTFASTGAINGANFVGGDSASASPAGTGGVLTVISNAASGSINVNSGSTIFAHGGSNSGTGNGGNGGSIYLESLGTLSSVNFNGTVDANGGSGVAGGNGGQLIAHADNSGGAIALGAGVITLNGAQGSGSNGGNGGTLEFYATGTNGTITSVPYGSIAANGGNGLAGFGGNGGTILWKAQGVNGTINHGSYSTTSANGGSSSAGKGGNGGTIDFDTGNLTTQSSTLLAATGGDATVGNAEGGDGGTINMTSSTGGSINLQGNLNATTGTNSGSVVYGGNGGSVTVTGGGPVNVSGVIKTSEDTVAGKLSKNGGKIQVTSAETDTSKPGITIANSGQLLALLNAASVGKGGKIEFTSAGGIISVAGTANAGKKGAGGTSGTDGVLKIVNNGSNGAVNILSTAQLRGDIVKIGALGNAGVLTINSGSTINADSQIKLFGGQGAGTVLFTGGGVVNLNAGSAITISANTVQVNAGTTVANVAPSTTVYSNNHNYNGGSFGSFQNAVTNGGAPLAPGGF